MRFDAEILHLLRKDLRHFRWIVAVMLVLACFETWIDIQMPKYRIEIFNSPLRSSGLLLSAALFCATAFAVFDDRPGGDRQFWLTRPVSWKALALEKLCFALATFGLPTLVGQSIALAVNGYSPLAYAPELLWNQVARAPAYVLAIALAAVLPGFTSFALACICSIAATMSIWEWGLRRWPDFQQWGGVEWFQSDVMDAIAILTGAAVIVWQYRRRKSGQGRAMLAASAILLVLFPMLPVWPVAFAVTSALSPEPAAGRSIAIAFGPGGERPPASGQLMTEGRAAAAVRLALPVAVSGIESSTQLVSERVSISVAGPDGNTWRSGWLDTNQVAAAVAWRNRNEWMPSDGSYWLSAEIPTSRYEQLANQDASVSADMTFTVATAPRITVLPEDFNGRRIPGVGTCSAARIHDMAMFGCVSPFELSELWDFQTKYGNVSERVSGCCIVSYGPLPANGALWADVGMIPQRFYPIMPDRITIEIRKPLAHFERHLEIPHVRLADYYVGRHDAIQ